MTWDSTPNWCPSLLLIPKVKLTQVQHFKVASAEPRSTWERNVDKGIGFVSSSLKVLPNLISVSLWPHAIYVSLLIHLNSTASYVNGRWEGLLSQDIWCITLGCSKTMFWHLVHGTCWCLAFPNVYLGDIIATSRPPTLVHIRRKWGKLMDGGVVECQLMIDKVKGLSRYHPRHRGSEGVAAVWFLHNSLLTLWSTALQDGLRSIPMYKHSLPLGPDAQLQWRN